MKTTFFMLVHGDKTVGFKITKGSDYGDYANVSYSYKAGADEMTIGEAREIYKKLMAKGWKA